MGPPQPSDAAATAAEPVSFTRLCVKNVPKHVDERRLRAHFATQSAQVTDAKLLRTKAGQARKMAFVGFRSEAEARAALKYFHGTFLDTSRLVVEAALPRGATALPRPWSRHSQGSSRFEAAQQKHQHQQKQGDKGQAQPDDPGAKKRKRAVGGEEAEVEEGSKKEQQQKQRRVGKEEFLATMMPRSRTQFWANDDAGGAVMEGGAGDAAAAAPASEGESSSEEEDEEEEGDVEGSEAMEEEEDEDEDEDEQSAASSLPEPEPSGLDFLRSKVKKGLEREIDARPTPGAAVEEAEEEGSNEEGSEESEDEESEGDSDSNSDGEAEYEEEDEDENEEQEQHQQDGAAADAKADADAEDGAGAAAPSPSPPPPSSLPNVEETGRLFIRNLPFSATEEDVTAALEAFGQVSEVHMPLDDSKRAKGFAFATFVLPEDAKRAMEALDGQAFQGRLLHVLPAKEPPRDPLADLDPSQARTYKERKEIERRQRAGDERGWNASFLRGETVVDAVADRLGVAKGQVLDREGEGMAVKLALGETFLLAENREFFRKEGVDLSVLEGAASATGASKTGKKGAPSKPAPVVRSKTTILVKNLPYSTSQEDLQRLFGRFGALGRVLLPPSRAIGLVDFLEVGDARRAFKGLAYKRYQHVPLYLEWAPLNTFTTMAAAALPALPDNDPAQAQPPTAAAATPAPTAPASAVTASPATAAAATAAPAAAEQGEEEVVGEGSFTLFVKNLNFATTDEGLAAFFKARTQGVRAVNIPKKAAPGAGAKGGKQQPQGQQQLSMGYGFVEYASPAAARAALRAADGQLLEGHKLQCKLSDKRLTARPAAAAKGAAGGPAKRTKLVVRNLAFQANVREIKELFGAFGKLKTVRLPKKFDGSHRGFAFVEFLTAQEAGNAFAALASTHLYGRHLVLEWAEDKDNIEALREKAQKDAWKGAVGRLSSDGPGPGAGGKKGKPKGGFDGDEEL